MLRKLFVSAIGMVSLSYAVAQDSAKPKPVINAYLDVYYRYNLANPKKEFNTVNNYTSFTNSHNSFELGMASVKLQHSIGKVGMVADLGFGTRAEEFSYNDHNTKLALKQAYLTYSPCTNFKLTAGSWATHIGYELVDPNLNRNYSMSYMFSFGPFFHTGVKAEYTAGRSGFMLGVADPTDLKSASFNTKFLLAQYSVATKDQKLKLYLNYQGGKRGDSLKMNQFDIVVNGVITDKFNIGYNGTIASFKAKQAGKFGDTKSWWGSALYFNVDPKPWFGFTLRGEILGDDKLLTPAFAATTAGGNIFETTLSFQFKKDNLTIIPEFRYDSAGQQIFVKSSGAATKNTASLLMAAIYSF